MAASRGPHHLGCAAGDQASAAARARRMPARTRSAEMPGARGTTICEMRPLRGQQRRALRQRGQQPLQLAGTAAGEHRQRGPSRVEAEGAAEHLGLRRRGHLLRHRTAHVGRPHAVSPVELLLEGQDAQHPVDVAGDLLEPSPPPRPHRGAHVEDHRDSQRLELARQPEIEVRHVDQQRRRRPPLPGGLDQGAEHPPDAGQPGPHLGEPHHRDLPGVEEPLEPCLRRAAPRPSRRRAAQALAAAAPGARPPRAGRPTPRPPPPGARRWSWTLAGGMVHLSLR